MTEFQDKKKMGPIERASQGMTAMQMTARSLHGSEEDQLRELARRHREYLERIQPWIATMARLHSVQPVRHIARVMEGGGLYDIKTEVLWNEESKKLYDDCQAQINAIAQDYQ